MIKFKTGFTLAEVLITLSIIGIIAAIVMPAVISSYQYKTVGVKLSKFASTTEDASRAFVVQNDSFKDNINVMDFINESYLIKSLDGEQDETSLEAQYGKNAKAEDYPTYYTVKDELLTDIPDHWEQNKENKELVALLKDNTSIVVRMVKSEEFTEHDGVVDSHKVGLPVFNINFDPHANGLPKSVQKNFNFIVTELGYVFPNDDDTCLWSIYNADWATNAKTFTSGSACNNKNSTETTSSD